MLLEINAWTREMMAYVVYENHRGHTERKGRCWGEKSSDWKTEDTEMTTPTNGSKCWGLGGPDPNQKTISP